MGCLEAKHELTNEDPYNYVRTIKNVDYYCNSCFKKQKQELFDLADQNLQEWATVDDKSLGILARICSIVKPVTDQQFSIIALCLVAILSYILFILVSPNSDYRNDRA